MRRLALALALVLTTFALPAAYAEDECYEYLPAQIKPATKPKPKPKPKVTSTPIKRPSKIRLRKKPTPTPTPKPITQLTKTRVACPTREGVVELVIDGLLKPPPLISQLPLAPTPVNPESHLWLPPLTPPQRVPLPGTLTLLGLGLGLLTLRRKS